MGYGNSGHKFHGTHERLESEARSTNSKDRDLHSIFDHIDDDLFAFLTQKVFKGVRY
jgi:hypothetical protein